MRLCNIAGPEGTVPCAAAEKGLVPLKDLGFPGSMRDLIEAGEETLRELKEALASWTGDVIDPEEAVFADVTLPGKILCVGLNYKKHAEETKGEPPERPVYFSKFNDCLCPHGAEVTLPDFHRCYDYEGELVVVIGRTAWNIDPEKVDDYIFGYTAGNDLSARDCQFLSAQWLAGKAMPGFAPAGPYIATKDAFDPEEDNRIVTRVNGEICQDDLTSGMIFTCRQIVADASRFFRLEPGDLIYTGTSAGVILGKPKGERRWLQPGDVTEIEIQGIGTLANRLV